MHIGQTEPANDRSEGHNKRRHPRYAMSLPGRFMRADKLDHPSRLIDISVESAAMTTPVPLQSARSSSSISRISAASKAASFGCSPAASP